MKKLLTLGTLLVTTLITASGMAEEKSIPKYFRVDQDYLLGLQFWAGAYFPLTPHLSLATDIFTVENVAHLEGSKVINSWWGEFDSGLSVNIGPLTLTPMAGIAFDWVAKKAVAVNLPQLYTVVDTDSFYLESWVWSVLFLGSSTPTLSNYIHTRNWVLYKATDFLAVGPQFEYSYNLNRTEISPKGLTSMPIGGHTEVTLAKGISVGIFLGYEVSQKVREFTNGNATVGRFTLVVSN